MTIQGETSSTADVVQSIWLGPVTTMERLVIASFIAHGHRFHLYSYDEPRDLPAGTVLRDARDVLPVNWVLRDSRGTLSGFADAFRYKLLLERGAWGVDMDTVCLRPFDFTDEYVFVWEPDRTMSNGVVRVPPGSDVMRYAWERARAYRPRRRPLPRKRLPWCAIGPPLMAEAVEACRLSDRAVEPAVFYLLDYPEWEELLRPNGAMPVDRDTKAVDLWNSMWELAGRDKDATYPHDCLYEQLKRRYLNTGPTE
jgi:hypothetical protein